MNQPINKKRVLLVEDDKMLSMMTIAFLEQQNIDTVHARDGQIALLALQEESFNVIISDLNMPQTDGLSFITELKKLGHTTPIFVTTGVTNKRIHEELYELGVEKVYVKPLLPQTYSELIERIKQYL
ncbi:response regulator [Alkalimarinus alittae]|uniref:Response regulator n=1 Tax=Alkalimarinus alittae TaxID=2961619 RepID=A0ABY6MYD4_9ALTE|nr:response regulator [Alkalimarinus alittae]UZE94846.1 response regulator [Alkalimarinus alittae]